MGILGGFADIVGGRAYHLAIDVAHCNLRCRMCPRGMNGSQNGDRGFMSPEVFERIVEKFVEDGVRIDGMSVGHWGEPLLNPDLPRMIRYLKSHRRAMRRGTRVTVNTSLNDLPDALELLTSGADLIAISISGMSQEVYSRNHRGGNVETVLENVLKLAEVRRRERLERVTLRMVFHSYVYNGEDAEAARGFCEEHGLRFTLVEPSIIGVEGAVAFARDPQGLSGYYGAFIDVEALAGRMRTLERGRIKGCHLRKGRVSVGFDGVLHRCVNVFEKENTLGPVFDFNIREIPGIDSAICRTCAETPITWR